MYIQDIRYHSPCCRKIQWFSALSVMLEQQICCFSILDNLRRLHALVAQTVCKETQFYVPTGGKLSNLNLAAAWFADKVFLTSFLNFIWFFFKMATVAVNAEEIVTRWKFSAVQFPCTIKPFFAEKHFFPVISLGFSRKKSRPVATSRF